MHSMQAVAAGGWDLAASDVCGSVMDRHQTCQQIADQRKTDGMQSMHGASVWQGPISFSNGILAMR
jgi:phosphate-selective porin